MLIIIVRIGLRLIFVMMNNMKNFYGNIVSLVVIGVIILNQNILILMTLLLTQKRNKKLILFLISWTNVLCHFISAIWLKHNTILHVIHTRVLHKQIHIHIYLCYTFNALLLDMHVLFLSSSFFMSQRINTTLALVKCSSFFAYGLRLQISFY